MYAALTYMLLVLGANLTATLFLSLPFGMVAVGTLIFGLTFTQRDKMHHYGRFFVYRIIFLTAILNFVFLFAFKYQFSPVLISWFNTLGWTVLQESVEVLAENTNRVFLASFIAIILSETIDTEIYHYLNNQIWIIKVACSNSISIPIDTVIFYLIAFAGIPGWSLAKFTSVIVGEIIVKYCISLLYALKKPRLQTSTMTS